MALLLAGCDDVPLLGGVSEADANRALAALDHAGIAAHKTAAGSAWSLAVARDDTARAVQVLAAEALPRADDPGVAETYANGGMLRGVEEEALRAEHARAGEIARTLRALDGVLDARVHLALPSSSDPSDAPRPRASVLLRRGGAVDEAAVRSLVAGAVSGLRADDVVLVVQPRAAVPPAPALATLGPFVVARRSLGALRATLAVMAALGAALVAAVLHARRRSAG